jgi:hypothetical protein
VNGTRTKTKPGQRYVVYCSVCAEGLSDLNKVMVVVGGRTMTVTCKFGHKISVGGKSHAIREEL